jgi:hypothetical protein
LLRVLPERADEVLREDEGLRVERELDRDVLERDELDPDERVLRLEPPLREDPDLRAEELDLRDEPPPERLPASAITCLLVADRSWTMAG